MKKRVLLAVVIALGLAGCAKMHGHGSEGPDPRFPQVTVKGGNIVVDQEPILVPKGEKNFRITWQLPRTGGLTFPRNGIVVEAPEGEFRCALENERSFACIDRNSIAGRFKYTIRVNQEGRSLEPLDPYIRN